MSVIVRDWYLDQMRAVNPAGAVGPNDHREWRGIPIMVKDMDGFQFEAPNMPRCVNCKCWLGSGWLADNLKHGDCRRHAPAIPHPPKDLTYAKSGWPSTAESDACGDF